MAAKRPILASLFRAYGLLIAIFGVLLTGLCAFIVANDSFARSFGILIGGLIATALLSAFHYGVAQILTCIADIARHTATMAAAAKVANPSAPTKPPAYRCPHCRAGIQSVSPGVNACPKCGVDFVVE